MKLTTKKSYLKTSHTNTSTVISSDGEVLEQEVNNIKYLANNKEEFFIIYSSLIGIVEKGMSEAETKLYAHLLQSYNIGAEIGISKQLRINLGKKLDLNERTILNTLGMLSEKKLIYTTSKGIYKINPRYAYKGSTINRNRDLKVVLEVECPTC
jgi:hypothetical protein